MRHLCIAIDGHCSQQAVSNAFTHIFGERPSIAGRGLPAFHSALHVRHAKLPLVQIQCGPIGSQLDPRERGAATHHRGMRSSPRNDESVALSCPINRRLDDYADEPEEWMLDELQRMMRSGSKQTSSSGPLSGKTRSGSMWELGAAASVSILPPFLVEDDFIDFKRDYGRAFHGASADLGPSPSELMSTTASTFGAPASSTLKAADVFLESSSVQDSAMDQPQASFVPQGSALLGLIKMAAETSGQAADFETLAGRFAMIVFVAIIASEGVTGNRVFVDVSCSNLLQAAGLSLLAITFAAGLAFAWVSKRQITCAVTRGCKTFMDTTLDKVMEGVFFDDFDSQCFRDEKSKTWK